MNYKCALIVVSDIGVSRKFYEDVLGQVVIIDYGANITFRGDFSLQTKATWVDFIDKKYDDIAFKTNSMELYFEEEQFDIFINKLKSFEIEYVHDIKEFSWGQRVIRFYDPDMHIIEVGESMKTVVKRFLAEGLSIEETSKRTMHPIEFINSCL